MKETQIEKYFNGTATVIEAEEVLNWFNTVEGQLYLNQRLDSDLHKIYRNTPSSDTANQTLQKILSQIDQQPHVSAFRHKSKKKKSTWIVPLLVMVSISFISYFLFQQQLSAPETNTSVIYTSAENEHRLFSLSDGTKIRLNENSQIEIPEHFESDLRSVTLHGEAYFEVASDSIRPFVVQTGNVRITVLGTSFVLKEDPDSYHTTVAVSTGNVSFGPLETGSVHPIIIEKNMIGYFNHADQTFHSEQADVRNYLSWMNGRIVFEGLHFPEVAKQLSDIYNIKFQLADDELKELRLTTNISAGTMKDVFETIAFSLGIEFSIKDNTVTWMYSNNND